MHSDGRKEEERRPAKKVSVVLPTYNGERYLAQAIQSVLAQTYENWELIVVDDCSTDGTAEIIQYYARQDARIRVIHNAENEKLPRSLNIGFRQARGDYLTWTSDDNFYQETALAVMVQALEAHPEYGMVYCDMAYLLEDGILRSRPSADVVRLYAEDVIGACFLYRSQVLKTVGEYDPDMILVEDYDYWLRISRNYQILHIPQCLYHYRFHSGSLTMTKEHEVAAQRHRLRLRQLDFLLEKADGSEREVLFLDMWLHSSQDTWQLRSRFFPGGVLPERLKWLERVVKNKNRIASEKELILFGAGDYGRKALGYFGREHVRCFVDNDERRIGTSLNHVPVISFAQMTKIYDACQLVLCVGCRPLLEIAAQLESAGIADYALFVELWLKK